jgi:hypothetical protein
MHWGSVAKGDDFDFDTFDFDDFADLRSYDADAGASSSSSSSRLPAPADPFFAEVKMEPKTEPVISNELTSQRFTAPTLPTTLDCEW